jgi:hypothetical protein
LSYGYLSFTLEKMSNCDTPAEGTVVLNFLEG